MQPGQMELPERFLFCLWICNDFRFDSEKNEFPWLERNCNGLICTVAALAIGMMLPIIAGKDTWTYITFVCIFFAAVLPMWLLKQPRDAMTTYMFIGMIAGAALGLLVAHPSMNLPAFTGFHNDTLGDMFPILFVTVACGAVSGFHSLVSSGTSSKTVANEKDMLKVGYGAMVLESLLAVLALCVAGAAASADGHSGSRYCISDFFQWSSRLFEMFGVPGLRGTVFYDHVCICAGTDKPGCSCTYWPYEFSRNFLVRMIWSMQKDGESFSAINIFQRSLLWQQLSF